MIGYTGLTDDVIDAVSESESVELARREQAYRGERPGVELAAKTVILVDDGLATGASMRAAIAAVRTQHPSRIVVAVPAAARDTCATVGAEVDELISPIEPKNFYAVSLWYDRFEQVSDEEVRRLLDKAKRTERK